MNQGCKGNPPRIACPERDTGRKQKYYNKRLKTTCKRTVRKSTVITNQLKISVSILQFFQLAFNEFRQFPDVIRGKIKPDAGGLVDSRNGYRGKIGRAHV